MVAVCGADVMSLETVMVAVWRRCDVFIDRDGGCVWHKCKDIISVPHSHHYCL